MAGLGEGIDGISVKLVSVLMGNWYLGFILVYSCVCLKFSAIKK